MNQDPLVGMKLDLMLIDTSDPPYPTFYPILFWISQPDMDHVRY